jgi:hypothetical protein
VIFRSKKMPKWILEKKRQKLNMVAGIFKFFRQVTERLGRKIAGISFDESLID